MSNDLLSGHNRTIPRQAPPRSINGLAVAGLVCGIAGLLLFQLVLGPLAIVLGGIGVSRAHNGANNEGLAIAGLALGIIALAIFIAMEIVHSGTGGNPFGQPGA